MRHFTIAFIQSSFHPSPDTELGAAPCSFVFRNQEDRTRRNVAMAGNWSLEHLLAMYEALAGLNPPVLEGQKETNFSWDVRTYL